jgi:hypothetical protein
MLKPHKTQCWLNSRERNTETFDDDVRELCELYSQANNFLKKGIHLESVDEKSGIQAIERPEPNKPLRSGDIEKYEHEYIRHGTQTLIASLDVLTGKVEGILSDSRGNIDFLNFIKNRVLTDSKGEWIFVIDQLNTHKSIQLVEWVAKEINYQGDLGKSGDGCRNGKGILRSMKSRAEFLSKKTHRIRFVYTPKHCSWMNQIEIWFSIISKMLLKRLNSISIEFLKSSIINFISYYNIRLAKPFKWTYKGKVLQM